MSMQTIRPGYLVSLHTSIRGGVDYTRRDLDTDGLATSEKAKAERWETVKLVSDADEHERAVKVRNTAGSAIRKVCAATPFGLICPTDKEADLDAAIVEAKRAAREFNASAQHSTVSVYVLKGRIADNDQEAAKAISAEVRSMIDAMNAAITALDPEAIREVATRLRSMAQVLAPDQAAKASDAIKAARDAARQITKKVAEAADGAVIKLEDIVIDRSPIDAARMAFLDLDAPAEIEPLPVADVQRFDGLDLDESDAIKSVEPASMDALAASGGEALPAFDLS